MRKKIQSNLIETVKNYSISIIDSSSIFALGLKASIEKTTLKSQNFSISINPSKEDLLSTYLDVLIIDFNSINQIEKENTYTELRKRNPYVKIVVSCNDFINLDFIKLYSININGLFSKSLNAKLFKKYFNTVLLNSSFIDYKMINVVINKEKKQQINLLTKKLNNNIESAMQKEVYLFPSYTIEKEPRLIAN